MSKAQSNNDSNVSSKNIFHAHAHTQSKYVSETNLCFYYVQCTVISLLPTSFHSMLFPRRDQSKCLWRLIFFLFGLVESWLISSESLIGRTGQCSGVSLSLPEGGSPCSYLLPQDKYVGPSQLIRLCTHPVSSTQ